MIFLLSRTSGCYGKGTKCLNFISKHWPISNVSRPFCTLSSNVWESPSLARSGHRPQFLYMSCHGEASICGPSFEQDCSKPFIGKCPWFQIESEKLSLTRTTGFNSKLPLDQKKKKMKIVQVYFYGILWILLLMPTLESAVCFRSTLNFLSFLNNRK